MSDSAAPPKSSNVALIVSLCVNFLLVGLIVTALVRVSFVHPLFGRGMGGFEGAHVRGQMQQMLSPHALMHAAPDKSDAIQGVIDAHRARIDTLRQEAIGARQDVIRAFTAPSFDKVAFERAVVRLQTADAALEGEVLKIVEESAETLTPDERRAAAMQAGRGRGHGWGFGHGHGRGPEPPP